MRSNFKTSEQGAIDQGRKSFIEAARRAQIIECAIDAIAELGFAQASLAQIAKRAGVSTGVISYYFAGKDDLIREVAAHVYEVGRILIEPRVDQQPDARSALHAFIEAGVDFIRAKPRYPVAIMNISRSGGEGPRFDRSIEEPRWVGYTNILRWGQETGLFRAFDISVMAATIIEALDYVPQRLVAEPDLDLQAYARELVILFDLATRHPNLPLSGD